MFYSEITYFFQLLFFYYQKATSQSIHNTIISFGISSTSKVKLKQKWYSRTKTVYLKRSNFSYMDSVMCIFI